MAHEVEFKQVREHWEVYIDGNFFCSADSYIEAAEEYYKARYENE